MANQAIAIVGLATELPSGEHSLDNLGHDEFFDFLMAKKDAYTRIPEDRFNIESWSGRGLGQTIAERGTFMKNVGMFDPTEFGIATKDARAMAVGARKLVELSFVALLDSGIDYRGKNVGCYASANAFDMQSVAEPDEMEPRGSLAGIPCMIANKISYHLDLRGPSIPVDTACSSSAVAMHMAVQAIRAGECEAAVVAGCQVNLRASDFAMYSQASILAPDGRCKPFDAGGNGFSRGEGAVVAVLKPLHQALTDGDYIYGTVLGTGVSSCGSMAPVNAPVAEAQADAMQRAYAGTGRRPGEVDYIEVHGTGTKAGDPAEANWVGEKFARDGELVIGSVKGNIGHLEITSFLASISKVLSIFRTKQLPPNIHLRKRNPAIHWDEYRLRVALDPEPVSARHPSGNLLVSICSSGIGGVNAHAVLESYERYDLQRFTYEESDFERPVLLVAAGLSPRSTAIIGEDINVLLKTDSTKAVDYSVIYGRRVRQMTWRSFGVKKPDQEIVSFSQPALGPRSKPPVVFLFSGQGPQHINMGRQLFENYTVFRQSVLEMDAVYKARTGQSLIHDIGLFGTSTGRALPSVWPISLILPSITVVQCALFDLLVSIGLKPDVLVGHSAGETALIYASGAGSKEMAVEISIARGTAMTVVEEQSEGTMAAVACSADDANRIIASVSGKHPDKRIEIACYNSPDAVALAGHVVLIDEAITLATKSGFMGRKIMTRVPVHCSLMDMCEAEFRARVSDVFARYPGPHKSKITTYSTCTTTLLEEFTAGYFWQNSRGAVCFTETLGNLTAAFKHPLVVEMSPHPVLASYVTELGIPSSSIVCPMRRSKTITPFMEQTTLLTAVGQLLVGGCLKVNFNLLNGRLVDAPVPRESTSAYPFAKKYVEYYPEVSRVMHRQFAPRNGPLNFPDLRVNAATHPELADHLINSEPIMPAAGFIEMGLEFGAKTMWNIKFHSVLSLSAPNPIAVEVVADGMHYAVKSRMHGSGSKYFNHDPEGFRLHADGYFTSEVVEAPVGLDIEAIKARCAALDTGDFYETLKYFAQYGPSFRRVDEIFVGDRQALVRIKSLGSDLSRDGKYILHPAILDASFHICVHPVMTKATDPNVYYLPAQVNAMNIHSSMTPEALAVDHVYAYVTFKTWSPSELTYDIALVDMQGGHLASLQGFVCARHLQVPLQEVTTRYELVYQPYGIVSYPPPVSSNTSDSGYESTAHDLLLEKSQDALTHTVAFGNKKVVRILELHHPGSPLLGTQLTDILEKVGALFPSYTVATKDIKSLPEDGIPAQTALVEVDVIGKEIQYKLNAKHFDLVVGTLDTNDKSVFDRLHTLLVPGASLILAGTSSLMTLSDCDLAKRQHYFGTAILESAASFDDEGSKTTVLVARAPSILDSFPTDLVTQTDMNVVSFAVGKEMEVQAVLKELDDAYNLPIWLVASEGLDADALAGFGRTIMKEFPQWNVRIATFARCYSDCEKAAIISRYLPQSGTECEFLVGEELCISVPRILPSSSPISKVGNTPAHTIALSEHEVLIEVEHCSLSDTGLWGLIGIVVAASSSHEFSLVGHRVAAVTTGNPTKATKVRSSAVTALPAHLHVPAVASISPVLVWAGIALSAKILSDPARLASRIVITHSDSETGTLLVLMCKALGLSILALPSTLSPRDLFAARLCFDDIIWTGAASNDQRLCSYIPKGAQILSWRSLEENKSSICRDPWAVADVLEVVFKGAEFAPIFASSSGTADLVNPATPSDVQLFSPEKSYILVGGVGSLGPYIALWMYQCGARHIVLTSRSGRSTLERMADSLPSRVFQYLESLSDLELRVEATDSSSVVAVRTLVRGLLKPLGGVILLATVFDDRLFFAQDEDSFKQSFSSKLHSMDCLEAVVDVSKLDFVISISSGTIWGNAGQTNYTSANTALDGRLRGYPNAFSVAAPAIFDTTSMSGTIASSDAKRASHLTTWAISPQELCNCLEDGLLKISNSPLFLYVPTVDFSVLTKSLGPSHLYQHMVVETAPQTGPGDGGDVHEKINTLVLQFIDVAHDEFAPEVPLTSYGLDSLSAGRLSFALKPFILLSQMQLLGDMSLIDIEERIHKAQIVGIAETSDDSVMQIDVPMAAAEINRLIHKYSIGLIGEGHRFTGPLLPESVVLITGTTGGLGSYFLSHLLQDESVKIVYAYNRPSTVPIVERQQSAFVDRALDISYLSSPRLVFLEGDASAPWLGLEKHVYDSIKQSVTSIIHNAWRLDLNANIKTFLPSISATRNLIDMALASPNAESIRFAFISTVASTSGWKDLDLPVPELVLQDPELAVLSGYGEAKFVAERIVAASGLQSSVYRVGQLCGASDSGAWAVSEWVPMIVKSSVGLDALPSAGGLVSWLAMDAVAPIVLESLKTTQTPTDVFNLVHPRGITWQTMITDVQSALVASGVTPSALPVIPFTEWCARLGEKGTLSAEELQAFPAIKVLQRLEKYAASSPPLSVEWPKYESGGWATFSQTRILEASATMRALCDDAGIITQKHAEAWVQYWLKKGLLSRV